MGIGRLVPPWCSSTIGAGIHGAVCRSWFGVTGFPIPDSGPKQNMQMANCVVNSMHGFHVDSALHEVVVARHSLHMWLQPKPKVVNAESVISAEGPKRTLPQPLDDAKTPRGRHGKGKMSETAHPNGKPACFAFKQHGKCSVVMLANLIMVPWNDYLPAQQKVRWWKRAMILTGCQRWRPMMR